MDDNPLTISAAHAYDAPLSAAAATEDAPPVPAARLVTPPADEPASTEQVIEALLFSCDTPLSAHRLAELAGGATVRQVHEHVEQLNEKYTVARLSFRIEAIAGGYRMMTLPIFRTWLARLDKQRSETRLSDAALETLAIIAYKQPIIRADIEAIRGVACGDGVNRLRELGLVRVVGSAEIVGRPMLYGTTKKFLDLFGLADLDELPPLEAFKLRALAKVAAGDEPPPPRAAAGA